MTINPNPTLFEPREASEPYSRGQWDGALKATPHSPKGDVSYVRALEPTARSGAHGFRSRRPRSLLTCSTIVASGLARVPSCGFLIRFYSWAASNTAPVKLSNQMDGSSS